jgi:hypothetical protein
MFMQHHCSITIKNQRPNVEIKPKTRDDSEKTLQNNIILKQAETQAYNLSQQPGPHGTIAYNIYIEL